jgi:hypothetical protein
MLAAGRCLIRITKVAAKKKYYFAFSNNHSAFRFEINSA